MWAKKKPRVASWGSAVRLGELVVDAVVAGPVVDGALVGYGVGQHEEEADGEGWPRTSGGTTVGGRRR